MISIIKSVLFIGFATVFSLGTAMAKDESPGGGHGGGSKGGSQASSSHSGGGGGGGNGGFRQSSGGGGGHSGFRQRSGESRHSNFTPRQGGGGQSVMTNVGNVGVPNVTTRHHTGKHYEGRGNRSSGSFYRSDRRHFRNFISGVNYINIQNFRVCR